MNCNQNGTGPGACVVEKPPVPDFERIRNLVAERDLALAEVEALTRRVDDLECDCAAKQARIDELMLEHCPQEMTKAQLTAYKQAQVVVSEDELPEELRMHRRARS